MRYGICASFSYFEILYKQIKGPRPHPHLKYRSRNQLSVLNWYPIIILDIVKQSEFLRYWSWLLWGSVPQPTSYPSRQWLSKHWTETNKASANRTIPDWTAKTRVPVKTAASLLEGRETRCRKSQLTARRERKVEKVLDSSLYVGSHQWLSVIICTNLH